MTRTRLYHVRLEQPAMRYLEATERPAAILQCEKSDPWMALAHRKGKADIRLKRAVLRAAFAMMSKLSDMGSQRKPDAAYTA